MRLNESCQKTHRLAIDLFLIMVLGFTLVMQLSSPLYEVVPDEKIKTIVIDGEKVNLLSGYTPQTNHTLISSSEYEERLKEKNAFTNRITLFGIIIFLLYSASQYKLWKRNLKERFL